MSLDSRCKVAVLAVNQSFLEKFGGQENEKGEKSLKCKVIEEENWFWCIVVMVSSN